ncbi:hypothetical protein Tco_0320925 [Tanacetum coccineum]
MIKGKKEQSRSIALKVKKEVSDEDSSSSNSEDEEYGDPNHLIRECSKPPKNNDQREFIRGAWSDNGEDEVGKTKDETCLVTQEPDEICLGVNLEPDEWIKYSGCSKHMTGGNFLDKRPADCSSIIESKSKVRHSRSKAIVAKVSTSASTSGVSPDVAELKDMVRALLLDKQTSPVPAPAPVKAVEQSCVTCGGAHSYVNCSRPPIPT